eukprot:TRINITY_DN105916_c0_g1_i1.p1 TRINITY_DN105916_c0_g1~~TRINITY_DN105916_c0_g1_i1.p1  ORF type:complete len:570 (+),score=99.47 TRINITY_DN105916_c0_g1_i1:121-1830(+)
MQHTGITNLGLGAMTSVPYKLMDGKASCPATPETVSTSAGTSLSDVAEEVEQGWMSRFFEFARAVIPLAAFIVLYCGLVVGKWFMSWSLAGGLCCVIVGLTFFKKGLMDGLMPFAQEIGEKLPRKVSGPGMVVITTLLGIVVTFAEPGIDSLQMVAGYLEHPQRLLLWLVIENPTTLLSAIALGVGMAAAVGMMRIRHNWKLLPILLATVPVMLLLTVLSHKNDAIAAIVPLAWDSGAITTGPATVPIVLALGAGLAQDQGARLLEDGDIDEDSGSRLSGFGVVTLASLYPVIMVLLCGSLVLLGHDLGPVAAGRMALRRAERSTDGDVPFEHVVMAQAMLALHSLIPLTGYLAAVQTLIIREPLKGGAASVVKAVLWCFVGLTIFNVGLEYGSLRLGDDAGQALPDALHADRSVFGPAAILVFGFIGGLIATFIDLEPCGLGERVEALTDGRIRKIQLFTAVAVGVGVGVAVGFAKVLFGFSIDAVLLAGYIVAIGLSYFCDEGLLCVAWDAAGVTTGPVTVPLVLSVGIGIADADDTPGGFGILACASVFPIIAVLMLGIVKLGRRM